MLTITVDVDAPAGQAIGIKEDLAIYLERYGDAKVVAVREDTPVQLRMEWDALHAGDRKATVK